MDSVVHFEIPFDKKERAQKFYKETFGWGTDAYPGMDYVMAGTTEIDENHMPKKPGAINGGMLKRQEPVKNIVITINVESIEKSAKKIEKNGGKIIRGKTAVADMGFSAYFKDSEGNVVGLWENAKK